MIKISDFFSNNSFILFRKHCNKNHIQYVEELVDFDFDELMNEPSFGIKKVKKIKDRFKQFNSHLYGTIINKSKQEQIITHNLKFEMVSEEFLNYLPLFSNEYIKLKFDELHSSYKPNESIDYLLLSIRAKNVLSIFKITVLGELLFLTPKQLMLVRNCGKTTIKDFQETVKKYLLTLDKDLSNTWDSFDSMIRSLLNVKDRDLKILKNRLGFGFEKPQTLEEVGKEFCVTRERIRQILNKVFNKLKSESILCLLEPFWDVIDSSLEKYKGAVCYDNIALDICKTLNWDKKIEGHAIAEFIIYFNDKYFIDHQSKIISFKKDECLKCNNFGKNLVILVNDRVKLSIDKATENIQYFCRTNCAEKMLDKRINKGMIYYYICNENNKEIKFKKDLLYSIKEYERKKEIERIQKLREQGSAFILIEDILKSSYISLSKKEIKLKLLEKGKVIKYDIALIIQRCENIFNWDRGIYIHRDNIKITQDLLKIIYLYIEDEFKRKIPFLSIHKVFNKFESECKDEQIPTDMALYSVLLIFKRFEYTLPQFPVIILSEKYANETIPEILEKYLIEKKEPVNYEIMSEYFIKDVGMKNRSFRWHLGKDENIIRLANNMITHRSLLPYCIIKPIEHIISNIEESDIELNSKSINSVINIISFIEDNDIHLSEPQKKVISLFQENNFSLSIMKLKLFSRINKLNGQQLINSINEKYIKEFNSRLVITEKSTMKINERFLDKFGWQ